MKNGGPKKAGAQIQTPLPYAFARRDEFLRLPAESRTTYLWEAHDFCTKEIGGTRFAKDELERNLRVLRRMMLQVAKGVAKKLQADGSWRDSSNVQWPRNHKGDDVDHWYDSGCFPPQFMSLPDDAAGWREVLAQHPEALFDEMIAWVETPAGQAGVGDEEMQKLLADRDTYLPEQERAPAKAFETQEWLSNDGDREAGLEWLAQKSADGQLEAWSQRLGLSGILTFLGGISSNRRPMEKLLPELMTLESEGDWETLQRHLDTELPNEAANLARLRACLPRLRRG